MVNSLIYGGLAVSDNELFSFLQEMRETGQLAALLSEEQKQKDIDLFNWKNEYLGTYFEPLEPLEFYREIFPPGELEREGHSEDKKPNAILTVFEGGRGINRLVFDNLEEIEAVQGEEFAIISPITYYGRNRKSNRAAYLYGLTFDLDGVGKDEIRDLFYQMDNDLIPQCTFCSNSGHGLHLFYQFKKPVKVTKASAIRIRQLKHDLTDLIWNKYTSQEKTIQYQGIFQGFRVVGTQTKLGKDCMVSVFRTGDKIDFDDLNFYLTEEKQVKDVTFKPDLTLSEAKMKFPEWYQKRIIEKQPVGRCEIDRGLYDWWLKKIHSAASVGHRYNCIVVLAAFAQKCNIPESELKKDAMALVEHFDSFTKDEHNHFTKKDVRDALKFYKNENAYRMTRKEAVRLSGIVIEPTKRNGRKQPVHMQYLNHMNEFRRSVGEDFDKGGRPSAEQTVQQWQQKNPNGKKAQCIKETGLSKPTVYKWWDSEH